MNSKRLEQITARYAGLSIALFGDFCLDRYLEIDPALQETSLETGLPVHNVTRVRSQPGAAGTVLNNLVALGVGRVIPLGFAGDNGEGFELIRPLRAMPGVAMDSFVQTPLRRTFTYCKPLVLEAGKPPRESIAWTARIGRPRRPPWKTGSRPPCGSAPQIDALIVMDQVDLADTGVATRRVLEALGAIATGRPELCVLADSRRSLRGYPAVGLKMNRAELGMLLGSTSPVGLDQTKLSATELARRKRPPRLRHLGGRRPHGGGPRRRAGLHQVAAAPRRDRHCRCRRLVTANLASALAAGASLSEAVELANAAASVVIHQLGTTGSATVRQIAEVLSL